MIKNLLAYAATAFLCIALTACGPADGGTGNSRAGAPASIIGCTITETVESAQVTGSVTPASTIVYSFIDSSTILGEGNVTLPTMSWSYTLAGDVARVELDYGSVGTESIELTFASSMQGTFTQYSDLTGIGTANLAGSFVVGGSCTATTGGNDTAVLEAGLNEWLSAQYPEGTPAGEAAASVQFDENPNAMPVFGSQTVAGTIEFVGADAPVTEVCMGFGSPTNAVCVPTSSAGASASAGTSGTATLELAMPPELCANLSQICHDIRCYEFARTSSGTFTRGNIAHVAAACGGCDEPSCQSLVADSCTVGCLADSDCSGVDEVCFVGQCVGSGALRFSLSWSAGTDFDLHVKTPLGNTIYFANDAADTGVLDVDDTVGGSGSVENVFFTAPPSGVYEYWVDLFSGQGGSWSLTVFEGGNTLATQSGTLTTSGTESAHFTITR